MKPQKNSVKFTGDGLAHVFAKNGRVRFELEAGGRRVFLDMSAKDAMAIGSAMIEKSHGAMVINAELN